MNNEEQFMDERFEDVLNDYSGQEEWPEEFKEWQRRFCAAPDEFWYDGFPDAESVFLFNEATTIIEYADPDEFWSDSCWTGMRN